MTLSSTFNSSPTVADCSPAASASGMRFSSKGGAFVVDGFSGVKLFCTRSTAALMSWWWVLLLRPIEAALETVQKMAIDDAIRKSDSCRWEAVMIGNLKMIKKKSIQYCRLEKKINYDILSNSLWSKAWVCVSIIHHRIYKTNRNQLINYQFNMSLMASVYANNSRACSFNITLIASLGLICVARELCHYHSIYLYIY